MEIVIDQYFYREAQVYQFPVISCINDEKTLSFLICMFLAARILQEFPSPRTSRQQRMPWSSNVLYGYLTLCEPRQVCYYFLSFHPQFSRLHSGFLSPTWEWWLVGDRISFLLSECLPHRHDILGCSLSFIFLVLEIPSMILKFPDETCFIWSNQDSLDTIASLHFFNSFL